MAEQESITLNKLFYKLYKQFQSIDNSSLSSTDPIYQQNVNQTLEGFIRVNILVKDTSMFSSNEELRDISTSNLKFLLVNYYLGDIQQKIVDDNRMIHLKEAKVYLLSFLDQLQKLNLLQKEAFLHKEGKKLDAVAMRNLKVSRFKRDKEANAKLNELLARRKKQTGNEDLEIELEDEDEIQRNLVLLLIDVSSRKAIEALEFIDDVLIEISILEGVEKQKKTNGGQIPKPKQATEPLKPVVITSDMVNSLAVGALNQRQEIMKNVFIYSNPATMTPEEWAEQQIRLGNLPDPNQTITNPTPNTSNKDDEDEDDKKSDEKTMKQRAWDNWVEDHPKGSGNMNDNYFKRG